LFAKYSFVLKTFFIFKGKFERVVSGDEAEKVRLHKETPC